MEDGLLYARPDAARPTALTDLAVDGSCTFGAEPSTAVLFVVLYA